MKMSHKNYNLRPLPGGRRGTPRAGAGCHSMQTIGDVGLSRRASIDKSTTAERRELTRRAHDVEVTADLLGDETLSIFSSIPSTRPSYMTRRTATLSTISEPESVVQDVNLDVETAPISGLSSKRKRWTTDMNKFILRTYLHLTSLDTDTKSYLEPLHLKFIEKYPNMQVNRQRVGDQRRAIIRNKLLPQKIIDQIHNEVRQELNVLQTNTQHTQSLLTQTSLHQTPSLTYTPLIT
jgi:hypothetical protein